MVTVNIPKSYYVAFIFTLKFIESLLSAVLSVVRKVPGRIVKTLLSLRGVSLKYYVYVRQFIGFCIAG